MEPTIALLQELLARLGYLTVAFAPLQFFQERRFRQQIIAR